MLKKTFKTGKTFTCGHCHKKSSANTRVKNQKYCGNRDCQNARKRKWEKEKLLHDPDYKENRRLSQKKWVSQNKNYWSLYRKNSFEQKEKNLRHQKRRNQRKKLFKAVYRATLPKKITKSGLLKKRNVTCLDQFWLIPVIAKTDPFQAQVVDIKNDFFTFLSR